MKHRHELPGKAAMITRQRAGLVFMGCALIGFGAGALSRDRLHYPNAWGGTVFAPFAIVIGLPWFVAAALWRGKRSASIVSAALPG